MTPSRFLRPGVTPAPKPATVVAPAPVQAQPATPAAVAPTPSRFARPGVIRAVVAAPQPEPVVSANEDKPVAKAAPRVWPPAPKYLDWDADLHCEAPWLLDDADSPETQRILRERRRQAEAQKNK